jgi:hypothetical protein
VHAAFEVFYLVAASLEGSGSGCAAVAAGADGDDRLVVGKRCELAFDVHERHVPGAVDVAVTPFAWLAHVEYVHAALCEPFCEIGGFGARGSGEETHGSG